MRHFIPQYDAPLLSKWMLDPDYANFFRGQLMPSTFDDCIDYQKWSGVVALMIMKKSEKEDEQDETAGMATLSKFDLRGKSVHCNAIADKKFQGNHDMRATVKITLDYCFKVLGLRKIITVFVEDRFRDFCESLGFKYEGIQFKDSYVNGQWIDVHRMSVLVEDWKQ